MKRLFVLAALAAPLPAAAQTAGNYTPVTLSNLAKQVATQIPATALSGLDVSNARVGSATVSASMMGLQSSINAETQRALGVESGKLGINAAGGASLSGSFSAGSFSGNGSLLAEKIGAANAAFRAVQDKFTDFITPQDFGATCNGTTDDSIAFQSAMTYAAEHGQGINIKGNCVVNSTITMPLDALGLEISGAGGGQITTSVSGDLFSFATDASHFNTQKRVQVSVRDLSILQTNAGTGTGFDFHQTVQNSETLQAFMKNVYMTNMQVGVYLHNVGGSYLDTITSYDGDGPDANSWNVYIEGDGPDSTTGIPAANNNITNSGSVRGNGIMMKGFIQGAFINNHRCLLCHWGIQTTDEVAGESLTILNSYEEANLAGFDIENTAFILMRGVSVDLFGPASPNWAGFRLINDVGSAIMDSVAIGVGGAGSVSGTSIFDIENSPGYYTDNYVRGLVNRTDGTVFPCWKVVGSTSSNDPTYIHDNICWASGNYQVTNPSAVIADKNYWSGPNNDTTVMFKNDAGNPPTPYASLPTAAPDGESYQCSDCYSTARPTGSTKLGITVTWRNSEWEDALGNTAQH